jgi:hypothetical protein
MMQLFFLVLHLPQKLTYHPLLIHLMKKLL